MYVRVRLGTVEELVALPSQLSRILELKKLLLDKFKLPPQAQRLLYGGKILENDFTLHDYSIKLNDVIQLLPVSAVNQSSSEEKNKTKKEEINKDIEVEDLSGYKDGTSEFFKVEDFVDVKHDYCGWIEGKIIRVLSNKNSDKQSESGDSNANTDVGSTSVSPKSKKGIKDYFSKSNRKSNTGNKNSNEEIKKDFDNNKDKIRSDEELCLLFKVQLDEDDEKCFKLSQIRPRARKEIKLDDLKINEIVMVNYNLEEVEERGYWYDFSVHEIRKHRKHTELYGTLFQGNDIMLNDVKIKNVDKIYAIEEVVPLCKRTKKLDKIMSTDTEKRSRPLNCTKCRDVPDVKCKECGCNICAGKNLPNQIILCDECNIGFHLTCLDPPLQHLPEEDWYCPQCRRNPEDVIAPGKAKQQRKPNISKTNRDWGRGMACVGKTQTCAMPANHFGPIPGTEVGMRWRFRIQLSESGVHRPPVSGIHGRDVDGAYSLALSGGYEDDVDNGFEFTYTGSGGRDLSGNKRTADQSSDQTLTRENRALAKSCAVKEINEEGADAEDNWKNGKPVRVVRSYKMLKHFPKYAPKEGVRYDGIYKVVKYYPETGKSGFRVWKYLLRRDDPSPAPWEEGAKIYDLVYPDGYLEAEAAKLALKEKEKMKNGQKRKRVLKDSNGTSEASVKKKSIVSDSPPKKKMKTRSSIANNTIEGNKQPIINGTPKNRKRSKSSDLKSPSNKVNPFILAAIKNGNSLKVQNENIKPEILSKEDRLIIENDELNEKYWKECLSCLESDGKQSFINKVTSIFLCIICQEVAANPTTTTCSHNFCIACLKLAFKSTNNSNCPYCRADLSKEEIKLNNSLKIALRAVMPGYDTGKK